MIQELVRLGVGDGGSSKPEDGLRHPAELSGMVKRVSAWRGHPGARCSNCCCSMSPPLPRTRSPVDCSST